MTMIVKYYKKKLEETLSELKKGGHTPKIERELQKRIFELSSLSSEKKIARRSADAILAKITKTYH